MIADADLFAEEEANAPHRPVRAGDHIHARVLLLEGKEVILFDPDFRDNKLDLRQPLPDLLYPQHAEVVAPATTDSPIPLGIIFVESLAVSWKSAKTADLLIRSCNYALKKISSIFPLPGQDAKVDVLFRTTSSKDGAGVAVHCTSIKDEAHINHEHYGTSGLYAPNLAYAYLHPRLNKKGAGSLAYLNQRRTAVVTE